MLIDTHCHLYPIEYKNAEKVIVECKDKNIMMILNGVDVESNKEIISLSKKYDNVFAAIGYDHSVVNTINDEDIDLLESQIKNNKIVAIGEIGIDYHYVTDNKDTQKALFRKMLDLAKKYDLPIIVHARDAVEDTYEILREYNLKGSMHCYQGSPEYAKKFIELGYYIGIDGPITFNEDLINLVKNIDVKHLLVETDSPYLSPVEKRDERNTPLNLKYIIKKISEIKNISEEELIKVLEKNSKTLFDLGE